MAKEILAIRLFTLHNIHFFMDLVIRAQEMIMSGEFIPWKNETLQKMKKKAK